MSTKKKKFVVVPLQKRSLQDLLDEACTQLDRVQNSAYAGGDWDDVFSPELHAWWQKRKALMEVQLKRVRADIIAHLTPIQKKALGL